MSGAGEVADKESEEKPERSLFSRRALRVTLGPIKLGLKSVPNAGSEKGEEGASI